MKVLGRIKYVLGAIAIVLATAFLGFVPQATAEEIPKRRIQASPATLDLEEMKPGNTYTKVVKIQNTGSESFKYEMSVAPYSVEVEDNKYVPNYTTETKYNDIAKWITLSQDGGELEAGKQDEITITVKVPQDVPAGGQYATILAKMLNDSSVEESGFSAMTQVGVVLHGSVDGNTRQAGELLESKIPSFMFAPPISATSVIKNTGNVHFRATTILQVYSLFGGDEVYTNEEDPDVALIMPETQRLNTVSWEGSPQLGIFKVKQTVKFLDKTEVTEKLVFICPIWFLLIVLAIIFLAVFWLVTRMRGRKD